MRKTIWPVAAAGAAAGIINGLLGAGGGMLLLPLLQRTKCFEERVLFAVSVCIMLPLCLTSLCFTALTEGLPWAQALPYLPGSLLGGFLAGKLGKKIPTVWLRRGLGIMILWGGVRMLWL